MDRISRWRTRNMTLGFHKMSIPGCSKNFVSIIKAQVNRYDSILRLQDSKQWANPDWWLLEEVRRNKGPIRVRVEYSQGRNIPTDRHLSDVVELGRISIYHLKHQYVMFRAIYRCSLHICRQLHPTGTRLLYGNKFIFRLSGGDDAPHHLRSHITLKWVMESKAIRAWYPPHGKKFNGIALHVKYYEAGEQVSHPPCRDQNHPTDHRSKPAWKLKHVMFDTG